MPQRLVGLLAMLRSLVFMLAAGLGWLFRQLFGDLDWQAPPWLDAIGNGFARAGRTVRANPRRSLAVGAVLLALIGGGIWAYRWYQAQPKPVETHFKVNPPALTTWDNGKPIIQNLVVEFDASAAPLANIGKPISQGISLSPSVAGAWRWESDKQLVFQPQGDWPVDGTFEVEFDKKVLLPREIRMTKYGFDFKTAPFTASIADNQFYQDPSDPNLKKLVATVAFSHPVDSAAFEKRISLSLAKDADYLGMNADATQFIVSYDKLKLAAYIHSKPLAIPREDTLLTLNLGKGFKSERGGNEIDKDISGAITIPGRFSLHFSDLAMTLVDNERFEPEQVLVFESSTALAERALDGKVTAYLLPVQHPDPKLNEGEQPYTWDDSSKVGKPVLAKSEPLKLERVPGQEDAQTQQSYKFKAPVGRYVYLQVQGGVQAVGGYQSKEAFTGVLQVRPYPRALKLLSQGALLSLSGDHKVGFLARGVSAAEIEIGRVLPNQLHHLADMGRNQSFSNPQLGASLENRLVERFTETRALTATGPGKPVYDSIDFSNYLQSKNGTRHGVFLVRISTKVSKPESDAANPAPANENGEENDGAGEEGQGENPDDNAEIQDRRLIVLTDLGLLTKIANDGSQDVFVLSIKQGKPVAGAKVDLVSVNGQVLSSVLTDANGRAHFADAGKFKREKVPLMFIAEKDGDASFLPLGRRDRVLDNSRFDVGGIENNVNQNTLTAYLFSDRGMYRPGESVHIGTIVRTQDWKASLDGIPLEAEVTDPRGLTLLRERIKLSKAGFEELNWATQPSSPTGHYQVSLYLVKDGKRDIQLGSTSVRVQEFEPDRMKVTARLMEKPVAGWITPEQVHAGVSVMHLFGAPASGRRVEGEMSLSPALPAFARYADYAFFDRGKLKEGLTEKLQGTTANEAGEASFDLKLQRFDRATYRLSLLARACEAEGGRNVAAYTNALVSSAPFLVGVKSDGDLSYIQRGAVRSSRWLAVDQQLNPVAQTGLTLEWVEHKYVSVLVKQPDDTYRYQSRSKDLVREQKPLVLAAGGSDLALNTREPGDFAFVVRDKDGHELNRLEYNVVGQANLSRSLERNAELQLKLDKRGYQPGETIEVSIRAPYAGAGLITIERDKVYQQTWFKADTTSSVQKITLPADFEGNGYVSVQFVRDLASDEIFMSPLSYGVVPFSVALDKRTEAVKLEAVPLIKPGNDLHMRISTPHPTRAVVFAIDEGILQVAGYKNADPLAFFFQKRALAVRTEQILDMILPEFLRLMHAAAPGGDADGGLARHINPFKRKNRPPVAFWSGIVDVGPASRDIVYHVPDYFNGKLRLMAVAVSTDTIGVYSGGTEVRSDLILTPNVPAMVAPGDEFSVSVGVFNNARGVGGPITLQVKPSKELSVVGEASLSLTVADQKEGVAQFTLRANDVLGAGTLDFLAQIGNRQVKLAESISVRPTGAFRTHLTVGRSNDASTMLPLARSLYPDYRKVEASVAFSPLAWSNGLSAYLDDYPHLCTEQLVSKAMPALMLTRRPELAKPANQASFSTAIQVLRSRQNDEGGFGLWSSSAQVDPLPSVYAIHFLLEAKERGMPVPADMLERANQWLQRTAGTGGNNLPSARLRAYAIYLLTRQGVVTSGLLGALQQELDARYAKLWQNDLTAGYVAASYQLLQQAPLADKLAKRLPWAASGMAKPSGENYYDGLVNDAQLLYLTARHFPARLAEVPPTVLDQLGKEISANRYNSLSAAYLILGLDAYTTAASKAGSLRLAEVNAQGKTTPLTLPAGDLPRALLSIEARKLQIGKDGNLPLFYSLSEAGFDRPPLTTEAKQGLEIIREFLTLDGKALGTVNVGDEFLVRLRLRTLDMDAASQIAIVDLLPGGVEPVLAAHAPTEENAEAQGDNAAATPPPPTPTFGESKGTDWTPDFSEARDDRVVLYGGLTRNASTFIYRVRATNPGKFQAPAPYAEGMYDRSLYARGVPTKLEIVKGK